MDIIKVEANIVIGADSLGLLGSFVILNILAFVAGVGFHLSEHDQDIRVFVQTGIQNVFFLVVLRKRRPAHAVKISMIPVLDGETKGVLRSVFELWAS